MTPGATDLPGLPELPELVDDVVCADCVRQAGVNWEEAISIVGQVLVSAARAASSLAAMPVMVSSVR